MTTFRLIDRQGNNYSNGLIWASKKGMIDYLSCLSLCAIRRLDQKYRIEESDVSKNEIKKYDIAEFLYIEYLNK